MHIPLLAAPTASGKTSLALDLANRYPIEIISADAMLVYKHLDVGTAKPSFDEQKLVKHHLIDIVEPNEAFSVADYVKLAESAIQDTLSRGKIPFLVGGTGFYIRALTDGLATVPTADYAVQQAFWDIYKKEGLDPLQKKLESFSPEDALRTQRNPRRVIRALEIIERTAKAPCEFTNTKPAFAYTKLILLPEMAKLEPRIRARTKLMFEAGWVSEVEHLLKSYPTLATAKQALGYDTIAKHLRGELSLDKTQAAITLATTQFAKRQRTWFKKEKDAYLINAVASEVKDDVYAWFKSVISKA